MIKKQHWIYPENQWFLNIVFTTRFADDARWRTHTECEASQTTPQLVRFPGPGERFPKRLLWGCEGLPSRSDGAGTHERRWKRHLTRCWKTSLLQWGTYNTCCVSYQIVCRFRSFQKLFWPLVKGQKCSKTWPDMWTCLERRSVGISWGQCPERCHGRDTAEDFGQEVRHWWALVHGPWSCQPRFNKPLGCLIGRVPFQ